MTLFRYDEELRTGMLAASTVALSCVGAMGIDAAVWTTEVRHDLSRRRCFRSFLSVGERPGRQQRPEENSHKHLNIAVVPAGNVV
jgi:hypothetical protein